MSATVLLVMPKCPHGLINSFVSIVRYKVASMIKSGRGARRFWPHLAPAVGLVQVLPETETMF